MESLQDTICALATAPVASAVAVVRVSGPQAFAIADAVCVKKTPCHLQKGHTLRRARVVDGDGNTVDDVLLAVFHSPRSFTGEDVVEVFGHGGQVPVRRTLAAFYAAGARPARPGEFTERAFVNGKVDLAQAEAVADIIAAETEQAHDLAQRQGEGRLSTAVRAIRDTALGVLAQIEASVDFPEDVGELDTDTCAAQLQQAASDVDALLATARQGILTRSGLHLVLVGRPNVGKSSLLNALLGQSRSIVSPTPGTTRDVVETTFQLRGIPVRAADTAGLRDTDDDVEQQGVARSRAALAAADLAVLVLDASQGMTDADRVLLSEIADRPHLVVWNKWDLVRGEGFPVNGPHPPAPSPASGRGGAEVSLSYPRPLAGEGGAQRGTSDAPGEGLPPPKLGGAGGPLAISAATGWNLPALEDAIVHAVGAGTAVPTDGAVVTHARHRNALQMAREGLENARQTLLSGLPCDFASGDVRAAIDALGEVTGETATADITREIFSRFCIGK